MNMQLKVRKIGNGYGVLFPKQLMEDMHATEDSVLNVEKVDGVYQIFPYDPDFAAALKAFRDTLPEHQNSYRELAK
jgi:antitoxin component of MazEF toxin-antitoxin module